VARKQKLLHLPRHLLLHLHLPLPHLSLKPLLLLPPLLHRPPPLLLLLLMPLAMLPRRPLTLLLMPPRRPFPNNWTADLLKKSHLRVAFFIAAQEAARCDRP